jgi:hypothetical protein
MLAKNLCSADGKCGAKVACTFIGFYKIEDGTRI